MTEGALPTVAELVPHSGAMVLLDRLVEAGADRVRCAVRIRPDSTFCTDGAVPAIVAMEYMAQAVAVYAGMRGRAHGEPPRVGYILGTRELKLNVDAFAVGEELEVVARHEWGDERLGVFECSVARGGTVAATAMLNVYQGGPEEIPT